MTARSLPLVPTLVVAAAVLLMVRLGLWQLDRAREKEALLATYAANAAKPPLPFVALWPVTDAALFRRTSLLCLQPVAWTVEGAGSAGWRHLAACRLGAEGPGVLVDLGTSATATAPRWGGGRIEGRLTWVPDHQPLVARLFGRPPPPTPLVVSAAPAPGLRPSRQPDPAEVPNNHRAYAVQWFLFAGVAVVVYAVALRRRRRASRAG